MAGGSSLGTADLMILLVLMRLGDDAYGVTIAREIEETSGAGRCARQRLRDPRSAGRTRLRRVRGRRADGRARRPREEVFRITGKGVREVRAAKQSLVKLWKDLPQLGMRGSPMTIQPPPSSARLLKRLVPNENHEALLGDLCEEYQRDRSLLWYRAQILAAIVIGSLGNVRTHWVLSMRAMTLGAATFLACTSSNRSSLSAFLLEGTRRLFARGLHDDATNDSVRCAASPAPDPFAGSHRAARRSAGRTAARSVEGLVHLQILAAIIVGCWKDIRTHRLLALRAIGIGLAVLVLYFFAAGALLNFVQRRLYEGILVGNHWIYWRERPQSWIFVRFVVPVWVHVGFLFSGWVIGRLHRAHGITFAVAFAAVLAMLLLALFIAAVRYASPTRRRILA